jgi:hypothetical protein
MVNKETRLQEAFEYIRNTFFPQWDKKHQWIAREVDDLPSEGNCERETKTISLRYLPREDDKLYLWLIHEICHSTTPSHGRKWINRMLRIASRAKATGHDNLAKELFNHVDKYQKSEPLRAQDVYQMIEDAVIDAPDWSYDDIINWVAQECGCSEEELEKEFKRCRKVYDEVAN